jgi:protein tyrosine phosphatase (PTP) superfamily phosphohydrolase (DUF442 family)
MSGRFVRIGMTVAQALLVVVGCSHSQRRGGVVAHSFPQGGCRSCAPSGPEPPRLSPTPVPPSTDPLRGGVPERFLPPEPATPFPATPDPGVRLRPPIPAETEEPGLDRSYTPDAAPLPRSRPPVVEEDPGTTPALPVDIPHFDIIETGVAVGHQPYPDGVAWLRDHGYRTALHVRSPGEDDSAARALFEKNGLRYLSIAVSADTLAEDVVGQFSRLVGDEGNRPLFVYDRDGSLAGALWLLHFRLVEKMPQDKAVATVERLGFRSEDHTTLWVAVQKYLSERMKSEG